MHFLNKMYFNLLDLIFNMQVFELIISFGVVNLIVKPFYSDLLCQMNFYLNNF